MTVEPSDIVATTSTGPGTSHAAGANTTLTIAAALFVYGATALLDGSAFWRLVAATMFVVSLPYFLLEGARSHFLAVILPFIITYLLYGRHQIIIRLAILAISFVCLDEGFKFVTAFRGTGFRDLLAAENPYELIDEDVRQSGLNMIQELCFANVYLESGAASPAYGGRYLNELLNVVPRVIWPSKPLIGIDYAKWRGMEDPNSELGVVATISTGMIGGGVLNFGRILGPIAAGILMALWTGLLIRWWEQRQSLLRLMLFMLGAGLTFNLGRDISLLVIWPVVFAYCFVRLIEIFAVARFRPVPQSPSLTAANVRLVQASLVE